MSRSSPTAVRPRPAHPGAWAVCLMCAIGLVATPAACAAEDSLRVMTFNVMYEPARAGGGLAARWPLVTESLRDADAHVIGLQEVMTGRVEPLRRALPEHRLLVSEAAGTRRGPSPFVWAMGVFAVIFVLALDRFVRRRSRVLRFGALAAVLAVAGAIVGQRLALVGTIGIPEEHLVLAYRSDRLRLIESGTMWLSPTPLRPGSHGPFDTGPHIAFAAVFARISGGDTLTVVNTHVGHSPLERARAARVLRGWLDARWNGSPQVLLGDLNATPDNPLVRDLLAAVPGGATGLRDAWTEAARRSGPATTYHWARPARDFFPLRIDYVLVRGAVHVFEVRVAGAARGGAVASDHDALIADLVTSPRAR